MDKDLELKLKQAKRQQQEAEEELQSAQERWRSEKRRLNAEIDRLEGALSEAKGAAARKKTSTGVLDSKSAGLDPAKIQEAADERFKKANDEWETERAKMKSQINRLEGAVAEAISRASNPMRATQTVREQFESELSRAVKEKQEIEQAFLRLKTDSEQEKLKLTSELVKLRRAAQIMGRPLPKEDAPETNPRVKELESRLKESLSEWSAEREKLVNNLQRLETASQQWDTERRQLNDHAGQLQRAFVEVQAKLQAFEGSARTGSQQDSKIEELQRQKQAAEKEFQEARNNWDAERNRLNSQVERLEQQMQRMSDSRDRVSNEVVDQLRKQYEQRLQEAIEQKTHLTQQLQNASTMLESERARLSAQIKESNNESSSASADSGTLSKEAISAEVARVEALIHEIVSVIDNPDTELSTVIKKNVEKAELDSYLKGILFSLGR